MSYNSMSSNLEIKVIDAGIGINKAQLIAIFSPYKQVNNESSFSSTGLGLSISSKIINMMQGRIKAWSKKNFGTCFTLFIPQSDLRQEQTALDYVQNNFNVNFSVNNYRTHKFLIKQLPAFVKYAPQNDYVSDFNKSYEILDIFSIVGLPFKPNDSSINIKSEVSISHYKILVAEDFQLNINLMKKIAEQHKLYFDFAKNGQEVIDMLEDKPNFYDVILMDIEMPIMDGLTATKLIRKSKFNTIPIIGLSANVEIESQQSCIKAGMNDFIQKPFNIIDLKTTIQSVCK